MRDTDAPGLAGVTVSHRIGAYLRAKRHHHAHAKCGSPLRQQWQGIAARMQALPLVGGNRSLQLGRRPAILLGYGLRQSHHPPRQRRYAPNPPHRFAVVVQPRFSFPQTAEM